MAEPVPGSHAYYDLGDYYRPISTDSEDAQTWFGRGLVWCYGFNHQAAIECFEQALKHDGNCAMSYWGLAYALGPNYNKPWQVFDAVELEHTLKRTRAAAAVAQQCLEGASPLERALVKAIPCRYPDDDPDGDKSEWNLRYAAAMELAYREFSEDLDVAALYADSLMNLTPWALWDTRTGKPAGNARTMKIKSVLEKALAQEGGRRHPGLLHLYIHLMEMSGSPESAIPIADHLRGLIPDAGHLQHMPTHLDLLIGDYRRAIASNTQAILADKKYFDRERAVKFYTLYRSHNYHFRIYAAMFAGQYNVAIDTALELESTLPEELLQVKSPPMADWLEGFLSVRVHVLVRFGRWDDLLALPLPKDQKLYCMTTAMIHYGKGIAYAATGNIDYADQCRLLMQQATKLVPSSRTIFNNTCHDILAIAQTMLSAESAYRRGMNAKSFELFRKAIELDDNLPYDEPWGWMQPTRHAYGALLLEQSHVEEAATVYAADLGLDDTLPRACQHPNNVWALHGYHECLKKLDRHAEAKIIQEQLKIAAAMADVRIGASCYCRLKNDSSVNENDSS